MARKVSRASGEGCIESLVKVCISEALVGIADGCE